MDKSAQGRLDKVPPEYEAIKPFLTAVINKHGERWRYPLVVARHVLIDMLKESPEINEQDFWHRLEDSLQNPPPPKLGHFD